ncbi:hypothetical protein BUE80_DR005047 [Diplocarpon rosae]|nr:hypothetical protein BUE80_DR005047 [Diplocarpon rosae]
MLSLPPGKALWIMFVLVRWSAAQQLQEKIDSLPECSIGCLSNAAASAGCSTGDFGCRCQEQDVLIWGGLGSERSCLMQDCGMTSTTDTQVLLRQICSIVKGSVASSSTSTSLLGATLPGTLLPAATGAHATDIFSAVSPSMTALALAVDDSPPPANLDPAPLVSSSEGEPTSVQVSSTPASTPSSLETAASDVQRTSFPTSAAPTTTTFQTIMTSILSQTVITPTAFGSILSEIIQASISAVEVSTSRAQSSIATVQFSAYFSVAASSTQADDGAPSKPSNALPTLAEEPVYSAPLGASPSQVEANQSSLIPKLRKEAQSLSAVAIASIVVGVCICAAAAILALVATRRRKMAQQMRVTSTASPRQSGEEITIYLDLQGEKSGKARSFDGNR